MTPVLVSVDKAGDLKLGKRKCRLHKKEDVVKVAKKYGVPNAGKKTVKQLCGSIKAKAKASNDGMNNVPLAKLYPQAAKKRVATKKRVEKKAVRQEGCHELHEDYGHQTGRNPYTQGYCGCDAHAQTFQEGYASHQGGSQ